MKLLKSSLKTTILITLIAVLFFVYIGCTNNDKNTQKGLTNANGEVYAGSVVCSKCHNDIYKSFINTAHFHTSSIPALKNIKGSFLSNDNIFPYGISTFMLMEYRDDKFFQTDYNNGTWVRSERFYIVIGSGTRGQSYLYKSDSQLYQLPVSYFANSHSWANSPGFPFFAPKFNRSVTSRCLECHSTFTDMSAIADTDKDGNSKKMIFGVECESCHGPGEKHVEFEEQNDKAKQTKFIINPYALNRAQKIEMCAYCHSTGKRLITGTPFTFKPGDSLQHYLSIDTTVNLNNIDVHGNQTTLLEASKCFKMSNLVCTTCHNTHQQERGELSLFSQRCMTCHNEAHNTFCKMKALSSQVLKTNCIDCHMPAKQSKVLTVNLKQTKNQTPAIIRSHFITIYPNETKKFLETHKQQNQ